MSPPAGPRPPGTARCLLVLAATAAALGVQAAATPLAGQTVRGRVLEAAGGAAVLGAFVLLAEWREGQEGRDVARAITGADGAFSLRAPGPGRFLLRVERIGYGAARSDPFRLSVGETLHRDVRAALDPVRLADIRVEVAQQCGGPPDHALATVWEEARKTLSAVAWSEDEQLFGFETRQFQRTVDPDLRIRRLSVEERTYTTRRPFASLRATELAERGYVRRFGDTLHYHAPDANALLSDDFLATHCFSLRRSPDGGSIGLAFEPVRDRRLPDIMGTLWLDAATAHLERLDFHYVGLEDELAGLRGSEAGGRIDFLRLPTGAWIVKSWLIRMPLVELQEVRFRMRRTYVRPADPLLVGYEEEGGEVAAVLGPRGRRLYGIEPGHLAGSVHDSVAGGPLAGATVLLEGTAYRTSTDEAGAFELEALEGTYRLAVTSEELELLGAAIARDVELRAGGPEELRLATPSLATLRERLCGAEADPATGIAYGTVRDADSGAPVSEAGLAFRAAGTPVAAGAVRTDERGRYVACGLPPGVELVAAAGGASRSGPFRLSPAGLERRDLALFPPPVARSPEGAPAPVAPGETEDAEADVGGVGPTGSIAGTVVALGSGEPVPGARVAVVGTALEAVTDEGGAFRLAGVPAGRRVLRVLHVGVPSREARVDLGAGDALEVSLSLEIEPVPLPELRVRIEARRDAKLAKFGFYDRMAEGRGGHFITRDEIEGKPRLSEAFRQVPSVSIRRCIAGTVPIPGCYRLVRGRGPLSPMFHECEVDYFLDGVRMPIASLPRGVNEVLPGEVEAIEVYTTATVPVEYGGSSAACGVVLIWTRTR